MSELSDIQKWFTSILIKPGTVDEKIAMADEHYGVLNTDVVTSSEQLPAHQRIWIYAGGYMQRLIECLESEYPVLLQLLGEDLFHTFARAYIRHFPSRTPDLYDLGRNFAAFLKASQPSSTAPDAEAPYALPIELANVERAIAETYYEKGIEGSSQDTPAAIDMFLSPGTSLRSSPCLKLLQSDFALAEYITATQHHQETSLPERKQSFIAISRKNFSVTVRSLEGWQWHFLQFLQEHDNFMAAVSHTALKCSVPQDTLLADLMLWLPSATVLGYVYMPSIN